MREKYELLVQQVAALIQGEKNKVSVLSNVSAALHEAFPERFFWVGFCMVEDGELQLGPFQGSVACMHIKKGKGVCGTSWEKAETIIVPTVSKKSGKPDLNIKYDRRTLIKVPAVTSAIWRMRKIIVLRAV